MCKEIDHRLVIGNYLIELLKKDRAQFALEDFIRFDEVLSGKLQEIDCFSSVDESYMLDFVENYPFVSEKNSDVFSIEIEGHKEDFLKMLIRYFRIGVSKDVVHVIGATSEEIWGANA